MELMDNTRSRTAVELYESEDVVRKLYIWLNEYPDKPVRQIEYEYLDADKPSMALSIIQGVYKVKQYIGGGYLAEVQFKLIYRSQPTNNKNRLEADEELNRLADWAVRREDKPKLGGWVRFRKLVCNSRSALFGRYENGDEDRQILMTMQYEVI